VVNFIQLKYSLYQEENKPDPDIGSTNKDPRIYRFLGLYLW